MPKLFNRATYGTVSLCRDEFTNLGPTVGQADDDAMPLRILHELRETIEAGRLAFEKRAERPRIPGI